MYCLKSNAKSLSLGNAIKAKEDSIERPLNKTWSLGFGEGFWQTASARDMASRGFEATPLPRKENESGRVNRFVRMPFKKNTKC